MTKQPFRYLTYIKIDELLKLQQPVSFNTDKPAHDEMLFVIVHQAYELWFKQIIFELNSILKTFNSDFVDERVHGVICARLQRITTIQKLMLQQIEVLETMTPLDFLDFINLLIGASGFQSFQFRVIEAKLGLRRSDRILYNNKQADADLNEEEKAEIKLAETEPSLFDLTEGWLERIPFVTSPGFSFLEEYRQATKVIIEKEEQIISAASSEEAETRRKRLTEVQRLFNSILDESKHNELVKEGQRRFSYRATLGALFINLYRDEPILQLPFKFLELLQSIDEEFAHWRYRHSLMVMRMMGSKPGTGGSSGHSYLLQTIEAHKIFKDLAGITTLFLPRSAIPKLPESVEQRLGFNYTYES